MFTKLLQILHASDFAGWLVNFLLQAYWASESFDIFQALSGDVFLGVDRSGVLGGCPLVPTVGVGSREVLGLA